MRAVVAGVVALAVSFAGQPGAAAVVDGPLAGRVPRALFGMHVADPSAWPAVPVGYVRLWDTGTTWRHVETAPGVFDWTRLDAHVRTARSHDARVLIVLGQTPTFHVSPTARPAGGVEHQGPGASRMPVLAAWRTYVRAVAERYAGEASALQVWNEANVPGFWSGTASQMARLTYAARTVLDDVNRSRGTRLRLVAPSFVARTNTLPMDQYWRQRVDGRSMNSLVDAVALSLYPPTDAGPEASVRRLAFLRRVILGPRHVTKPVWTTEVNYGLALGGSSDPVRELAPRRQAAFVARTYLLQADAGVRRVFWYGWSQRGNVSTVLSIDGRPTAAGLALDRVQRWMRGSRLLGCHRVRSGDRRGLRVCALRDDRGLKRVMWHPYRQVAITLDDSARWVTSLDGSGSAARSTPTVVDYHPVLVRYRR